VERKVRVSIKKFKKQFKNQEITGEQKEDNDYEIEKRKTKEDRGMKFEKTFRDITQQIQKYISTKFLISLITGFLVAIILLIFQVDFLIVWAVLTFLLNFIPNIGSVIAVILPTLMTLVQYESFPYAMIVAVIIIAVQNIIGNIIEPKIVGDRLGLNPLVILLLQKFLYDRCTQI